MNFKEEGFSKKRDILKKKNHTEQYESDTHSVQGGKRRGGIAEGSCESLEVEGVLLQTEVTESSINVLQYLQSTTAVQIKQQHFISSEILDCINTLKLVRYLSGPST